MKIANLTQHIPIDKQVKEGVVHLPEKHQIIKELLTFENIPSKEEMIDRAERLARIVEEEGVFDAALIGGAPYFMSTLEKILKKHGIKPLYSFSQRKVKEIRDKNEVKKEIVFEHIGFVEV